jgi:hypothetical protein
MVARSKGLGPEKDYPGEGHQHIQKTDPSSSKRLYMKAGVKLWGKKKKKKRILAVILKGLGAKTTDWQ